MSRNKKILLLGGVVVMALLIGPVIMVHLLVTPERVKGWALPVLEENLHRKVALADVGIGLFSGIELHDLQVKSRDEQDNLLQLEALVLSYRFWPLLSGQLIVDDVHLVRPTIRLVKNDDGTMNIDDLIAAPETNTSSPAPSQKSETGNNGIGLLVSRVFLEGGNLMLVRNSNGADDIHLQNIHLLAKNISLDDSFPFEFSARLDEMEVQINGDFQISTSQGQLDLLINRLDLNQFITGATDSETSKSAEKGKGEAAPAEDIGPLDVPVTLGGTVKIAELLYQDIVVDNVQAEYQLANNHFLLRPLTGHVAEGQFQLQADVDLGKKGFVYNGDFSLQGLNLQALIPALMPQAEKSTHGLMQLQLDFSGAGVDPAQILNRLQSKGSFQLADGKLMGSPLLVGLAKFLGNPELKVLSFQSLTGQFDLQHGTAQVAAALESSKTRFDSSGTVDLDGPLKLQLDSRLSPEILEGGQGNSPLGRAFTDPDGWGVLPLKIAGTYTDPKFNLSSKGLQSQATEKAKQELEEELQERFGEDIAPAKEMIDDSLNKLFGQ